MILIGRPSPRCLTHPFQRRVIWIALTLVAVCAAAAATAQGPPEQGNTFLWTIASPTATVHLLGSVHVASADTYPLNPRIESAFETADTLVLEMALDPATQVQVGQKFASAGTYPEGDAIDLHLNREALERLRERLNVLGAPFNTVRSFRPWFVATLLTLGELQRLGYRPDLGIDVYFAGKARSRKRILGLESIDEQVALFAGMTETVQEEMLTETLNKLGSMGEYMGRALQSWRTGNAKNIDELLVAPVRNDYPDMYRRLFVDRNQKMAAAVEGYLKASGNYFVVVGAGHLVGPGGILDLLRQRGYSPVQE